MNVRTALLANRVLFIAAIAVLIVVFTGDGVGMSGWTVIAAMLVTLASVVMNAVDFFYHLSQRKGIPTVSRFFFGLSVLIVGYLFYCLGDFFIANPPSDY